MKINKLKDLVSGFAEDLFEGCIKSIFSSSLKYCFNSLAYVSIPPMVGGKLNEIIKIFALVILF